jgi:ribonuclease VapC
MVLDSSAVVAIAFREPERDRLLAKIGAATLIGIGVPTLVETAIVLTACIGDGAGERLDRVLDRFAVVRIPFDERQGTMARAAWIRFGRGRHPAALNFGDCLAYATAKLAGRPLLCTGDDFPRTDIALA